MSGYSFATSAPTRKNRPSVYFMMLALATALTFLRPFWRAYSKAVLMMRREPVIEIGLIEIAAVFADLAASHVDDLLRFCRMHIVLDARVQVFGILADDHRFTSWYFERMPG